MTDTAEALTMLMPYPAESMQAFPVSKKVNSAKGQGPELILPVTSA